MTSPFARDPGAARRSAGGVSDAIAHELEDVTVASHDDHLATLFCCVFGDRRQQIVRFKAFELKNGDA